ncbi:MAG: RNA polymerase sigma-70 factor (ECF subfamily) [Planctomycetota bacterium]|jgi:RNA polymerase sigma-70 factor (ECF subfamily)
MEKDPISMPQPPANSDPLAALLFDGPWLRRLAVGLVGESGAEDLTQDVLVAALQTPPREGGAQLRSWAKIVARRLAIRGGDRNRSRKYAERSAARPEASDQESEQRLLLHQRLTEAILALEPLYRTALVMRYLEGLAPQEIAGRLDIAPATARKRISRGLVKLREGLDKEFGERTTWMNALGPVAFGAGWKGALSAAPIIAAVAPATLTTSPPLLALWTMKKLLFASIVLGLTTWAGMELLDGAGTGLEEPNKDSAQAGLVPTGDPGVETETHLVSTEASETRNQASPAEGIAAPTTTPQIRLVNGAGEPAAGSKGAWIDENMNVHLLVFDEAGRADLPEAARGSLCLVRAEGLAIKDFLLEGVKGGQTVELGEFTTLSGRLIVHGAPPMAPLDIDCRWNFSPSTPFEFKVTRMPQDQGEILHGLGLSSAQCSTRTLPGGQFTFEGVQPASRGQVQLPKYLKVLPDGKWSQASFQNTHEDLVIETRGLPYVHGRLIWADDENPYQDSVTVQFTNRRNQENETKSVQTSESGEFLVPLEYLSADKAEGLKHTAIRLRVKGGRANGGQGFLFPVDIESPVRNLGVVRVNRQLDIMIRTVDDSGRPVAEAFVESSLGRGRTDKDGRISLSVPPAGVVLALANGHGFTAFDRASAEPDSEGEYVIRLPQGNDLTITASAYRTGPTQGVSTSVRFDLPNGLIGAQSYQGRSTISYYLRAIDSTGNRSMYDWGVRVNAPNANQPIVLPGLKPGTRIKASLHDARGHALVREEIVIANELRPMSLELMAPPDSYGTIDFEVVSAGGHLLQVPWVRGLGEGWLIPVSRGTAGRVKVGPLATGSYRFLVGAQGRASEEIEVHLAPGNQQQKVVLLPGRSIDVSFVDSNGVTLHHESAQLEGPDGKALQNPMGYQSESLKFSNVAREPLELVAQVGTQTIRHAIGFEEKSVEIRLPATGKLRTYFEAIPMATSFQGEMVLRVSRLEGAKQAPLERIDSFNAGATGAWDLKADLFSGTYSVHVLVNTNKNAPEGSGVIQTLFEGQVTIIAGEESLIHVTGGSNPRAALMPR